MKVVKSITRPGHPELLRVLGGLLALGVSASASAVCVQDLPGATTVLKTDGNQSCSNISGQTGCRIEKGAGSCDAYDTSGNLLFTATSENDGESGLSWSISAPEGEVLTLLDAVTVNGARSGNTCVYIYGNEADSGSGIGDFDAGKSSFANVQYAEFCTDGDNQTVEPGALPDCAEIQDQLDGTGIDCDTLDPTSERFLISLDPNSPDWNPTACTCNVTFSDCNEEATVVGGDNKCTGDNPLQALPVVWEAGNDGTWICRTIGGERKCWNR